tara:strand:+ start:502 stop:2148 length:1647 start_codon:yes stop_codon:yes gene_type:complete
MIDTMNLKILVIIPARGGSKGIPRKNLRSLAGKPLIYYSIKNALSSSFDPDVYVTSDDGEILNISHQLGAKVLQRDSGISSDLVTLDPVVFSAYEQAKASEDKDYDLVITLQPTSPLLTTESLDDAITRFVKSDHIDTIISAVEDTHLSWRKETTKYLPNYSVRLNRQELPPSYKETGGFLISRASKISPTGRIGGNVSLYLLDSREAIDIDTYEDWSICEYVLNRKKILFVVSGYKDIGLGHVYNTLIIANDILDHQVEFLVDENSEMAFDKISKANYPVFMQESPNIVEDIALRSPDVVINDRLDTDLMYVEALKAKNIRVINFEDLGHGTELADLVINAIYPKGKFKKNHYFGHKYFILRNEFVLASPGPIRRDVGKVLITFGGVDPNNLTLKVLKSIHEFCRDGDIDIEVILGPGYGSPDSLDPFTNLEVRTDVGDMSEHMKNADIIFSSAGRTVYEIASMGVPSIILAQNARELTHQFASAEYGFCNLGLGYSVSSKKLLDTFKDLVGDYQSRLKSSLIMKSHDLRRGRYKTLKLLKNIIEEL